MEREEDSEGRAESGERKGDSEGKVKLSGGVRET